MGVFKKTQLPVNEVSKIVYVPVRVAFRTHHRPLLVLMRIFAQCDFVQFSVEKFLNEKHG